MSTVNTRRTYRPLRDVVGVRSTLTTLLLICKSSLVSDPPCDVTELFDLYDNTLTELLDKHAPWQQVKLRERPTAPWFDAECRVMKAKTRKLEKVYRRQRSAQTEHAWRT